MGKLGNFLKFRKNILSNNNEEQTEVIKNSKEVGKKIKELIKQGSKLRDEKLKRLDKEMQLEKDDEIIESCITDIENAMRKLQPKIEKHKTILLKKNISEEELSKLDNQLKILFYDNNKPRQYVKEVLKAAGFSDEIIKDKSKAFYNYMDYKAGEIGWQRDLDKIYNPKLRDNENTRIQYKDNLKSKREEMYNSLDAFFILPGIDSYFVSQSYLKIIPFRALKKVINGATENNQELQEFYNSLLNLNFAKAEVSIANSRLKKEYGITDEQIATLDDKISNNMDGKKTGKEIAEECSIPYKRYSKVVDNYIRAKSDEILYRSEINKIKSEFDKIKSEIDPSMDNELQNNDKKGVGDAARRTDDLKRTQSTTETSITSVQYPNAKPGDTPNQILGNDRGR